MRVTPEQNAGMINSFTYLKKGRYFTQDIVKATTYGSSTLTNGRLYVMPFYLGSRTLIDRLAINVVTNVAPSNARIGIYASLLERTLPGNLLVDKEVSTATTGVKQDTSVSVWLSGNRIYWLAVLCSADVELKVSEIPSWILGVHKVEDSTSPEQINYLYGTQTYGALPNPCLTLANLNFGSSSTGGIPFGPAVWFRTAP